MKIPQAGDCRPKNIQVRLLGFFVRRGAATPLTILVELQLIWSRAFVFVRVIVPPFAFFALERHQNSISAGHFSILKLDMWKT